MCVYQYASQATERLLQKRCQKDGLRTASLGVTERRSRRLSANTQKIVLEETLQEASATHLRPLLAGIHSVDMFSCDGLNQASQATAVCWTEDAVRGSGKRCRSQYSAAHGSTEDL